MNKIDHLIELAGFKAGDRVEGFEIRSLDRLEEYQALGIHARHLASGLELYHFFNDDRENLFSFCFKTPPADDTGAPHIIEHSVLSGSEKYPIKDPFQAFLKGSVHTFMNAMTYPEKTLYPAASVLKKDYTNLMRVYADSVFHPLLTREIFEQEASRIEVDREGKMFAKGIVFNEMQGSYGDKERLMYEYSYQTLFPDTPYRFDSGGVPASIPDLDYEGFLAFYKQFYHPANCRLFLYGDIPSKEQFALLDQELLQGFQSDEGEAAGPIALQRPWDEPKQFQFHSPASDEDDGLAMTTVNWLVGEVDSPKTALTADLLSSVLLDHPGSPLYKALLETGLGEDISPSSGMDSGILQAVFSCGLRSMKPENCRDFDRVVISLLEKICEEGIPAEAVEGSLRQFEFRLREIRGGIPNGLRMMDRALHGWLHGGDPSEFLQIEKELKALRSEIESDPRFFEKRIRSLLIENHHRSQVCIIPDAAEGARVSRELDKAVERRVEKERESDPGYPQSRQDSFYEYQKKDDRPEDLAKLPALTRDDLSHEVTVLELKELGPNESGKIHWHPCFCNRISYYSVVIELHGLSEDEQILLPVLARMMSSSSLEGLSHHAVAHRLALLTGAFYPLSESGSHVSAEPGTGEISQLSFRAKMTDERVGEAVEFVHQLILEARLDDHARLRELLLEMRNDFKSSIVPEAADYALIRSRSPFSRSTGREELWRGLSQYALLELISAESREELSELADALSALRNRLLDPSRVSFSLTCEEGAEAAFLPLCSSFMSRCKEKVEGEISGSDLIPFNQRLREKYEWFDVLPEAGELHFYRLPAGVAYNVMTLPGFGFNDPLSIAAQVLAMLMNTEYLWSHVRMQGGAYGSSCGSNSLEGYFSFYSYRDPSIMKTLGHFKKALESYAKNPADQEAIDKTIITIAGKEMKPLKPGERGSSAYRRELYGITDEMRLERREQLLTVDGEQVKQAAATLLGRISDARALSFWGPESSSDEIDDPELSAGFKKVREFVLNP